MSGREGRDPRIHSRTCIKDPQRVTYCSRCRRWRNEQDPGNHENNMSHSGGNFRHCSTVRAQRREVSLLAEGLGSKNFTCKFPRLRLEEKYIFARETGREKKWKRKTEAVPL